MLQSKQLKSVYSDVSFKRQFSAKTVKNVSKRFFFITVSFDKDGGFFVKVVYFQTTKHQTNRNDTTGKRCRDTIMEK